MFRLLPIFGCCLLLVTGNSLEESQESQELVDSTTPLTDNGFPISAQEAPRLEVPSDLDQDWLKNILAVEDLQVQDLIELLRSEQFKDAMVANAVRLMRTPEFWRIVEDIRSLDEYPYLTDELEKAGDHLRKIQQVLNKYFGW